MAQPNLPVLERQVAVTPSHEQPEFQSSVQAYAASSNSLSAIGAQVAQSASNQMAQQLGTENGKNPHGDLSPPITEFDKNFADSYHQQAYATLQQQGDALLQNTHVEMSKFARLTPEQIMRTHEQLNAGLSKISEQAPTAVKTKLQAGFNSKLLEQSNSYKMRMFHEQREDQKNNLQNAIDLNIKNVLEHNMNGDNRAAASAQEAVNRMADNAVSNRFMTPEAARIAKESAHQAYLNGFYSKQAVDAWKDGKFPEFEKQYSEDKHGMTNEQWLATGSAFTQQVGFMQTLRSQDEHIKVQEMQNQILLTGGKISNTDWTNFENNVSKLEAEKVKFTLIQARLKGHSSTTSEDELLRNFGNPEAWANADPKVKNLSYRRNVEYLQQQKERDGKPISHEDAEVQVAASAGGSIPVFVNTLKNKLRSGNPAFIESASQQIHSLQQMGKGGALVGLSDNDHSIYTQYEALRDSRDPQTAAREAVDNVLNQDPARQRDLKQNWSNKTWAVTKSGENLTDWATKQVGIRSKDFINPGMAQVYGADILSKLSSLYQSNNGDFDSALKLTKQYVNDSYGDTGVNGGKHKTLNPIEKVLGFQNADGVPYIQKDIINQLSEKFAPTKKLYDEGKINDYWEIMPLSQNKHGIFSTTYDPVQIKHHSRSGKEVKENTYNLVLHGNNFDNWDVALDNGSGMRNLFQMAPYLAVTNYTPNRKSILDAYNKDHQLK